MNYLAHTFLSPDDPFILTGNVVTDLLKGDLRREVDERFAPGIRLHREIDRFTDAHEAVQRLKHALHDRFHKYAPVVSDIYMDHLLVLHWERFCDEPLDLFVRNVYEKMYRVIGFLPDDTFRRIRNMIDHNWLYAYLTYESVEEVFQRMNYKVSDKSILNGAGGWLRDNLERCEGPFLEFFPQLVRHIGGFNYS